jgi:glycosyltransferase involved in cell wall biosynthesis
MISVALPTYNRSHVLKKTLDSIKRQTHEDFEVIVVDDCSTDGTREIMESYNDPRFKMYHNDTNLGIAMNRNKAISLCSGEYIAMMDDDDLMTPDRLELSLDTIENYSADIVYSPFFEGRADGSKGYTKNGVTFYHVFDYGTPIEDPSVTEEKIKKDMIVTQPTVMAKRECWESTPYRERPNGMDDDHYVILSWWRKGYVFKKMPHPVLIKRFHDTNHYLLNKAAYIKASEELV